MSVRCAHGFLLVAEETCPSCRASSRGESAPHDLTPSEVALARVLAAWEAWDPGPDDLGDEIDTLDKITNALDDQGLIDNSVSPFVPNARASSLLARARKAGVL